MTTISSADAAATLARQLLQENLIACATIIPGGRSIYRWQGQIHDEHEAVIIMKTVRSRTDRLKSRLKALHTYELPELILLEVRDGLEGYIRWVVDSTQGGEEA